MTTTMKPGDLFYCPMALRVLASVIDNRHFSALEDIDLGITSMEHMEEAGKTIFLIEEVKFKLDKHSNNFESIKWYNDYYSIWKVFYDGNQSCWAMLDGVDLENIVKIN
jgi:hypothetical protein